MHVALCFWGLCRSTDLVLESIEQYILEPLRSAGVIVDIYLHTYTLYRPYTNIRSEEFDIQLKNTNWKLLRPKASIVDNQDTVDKKLKLESYRTKGDPWSDDMTPESTPYSTLDNHIRSLWSLKQVTSLWCKSAEAYTRVIYLRPDVLFLSPLNIKWLNKPLDSTILIPDFHHVHKCNDRFAIGEPAAMKVYGGRFDVAYEYSRRMRLHSEKFLYDYMTSKGYTFATVRFRFRRIRADGKVCVGDKDI
jgi:hypothetical protein